MSSAYRQIVFECPACWAEALSDALLEAGALSVDATDARAGTADEDHQYGEPGMEPRAWTISLVKALFPPELDSLRALCAVCEDLGMDLPSSRVEDVPEQDWVRLTQAQFEPIHASPRLWIVPSWCDSPTAGGEILVLDPGLAFGTGSHPTTRLCLNWIDTHLPAGASLLDYGCGSGVLALAASRFGAGLVLGIDIDPQSIVSSRYNAEHNHCPIRFELPADDPGGSFDVVVANILSNPLMVMAPMLAARVKPRGELVLSGILERQAEQVMAAYAPWLALSVWGREDGWVCLHGRRPEAGVDGAVL